MSYPPARIAPEVVPEEEQENDNKGSTLSNTTTTLQTLVQNQLHDLRLDLRRLEPHGLVGTLVLGWWLYPTKFVADPVFGIAERVVPAVVSQVPLSGHVVNCGLQVTTTVTHTVYGVVANTTGLVSSNASLENIQTLSQLQALRDQSRQFQEQVLQRIKQEAQQKQALLVVLKESAVQTVTEHGPELLGLMYQGYSYLYHYGSDARVFRDVRDMGQLRYVENKALLGVIQQADAKRFQRVDQLLLRNHDPMKRILLQKFPMSEAAYFVKFATAAYGDNAIVSTSLVKLAVTHVGQQVQQQLNEHVFDWRKADMTALKISEHTGIPVHDILVIQTTSKYAHHLPYLVALDHKHSKLILAIRGTYTHREIMLHFNGYSRPFLGGEAHAAISVLAERLWDGSLGDDMIRWMDEYPDYELIVTGHSLGGGCACLLNLLMHRDVRMQGRKWRVFAYGSPPVYVPSFANVASSQTEVQNCINYIHQYDSVPFLSGDSVRHQIAMIAAIQKADLDLLQRGRLLLGLDDPTVVLAGTGLIQQLSDIQHTPLSKPQQGCPRHMAVPAVGNVWILSNNDNEESPSSSYRVVIADSLKMSEAGIFIHKNDLTDHLPARYEHVLQQQLVK